MPAQRPHTKHESSIERQQCHHTQTQSNEGPVASIPSKFGFGSWRNYSEKKEKKKKKKKKKVCSLWQQKGQDGKPESEDQRWCQTSKDHRKQSPFEGEEHRLLFQEKEKSVWAHHTNRQRSIHRTSITGKATWFSSFRKNLIAKTRPSKPPCKRESSFGSLGGKKEVGSCYLTERKRKMEYINLPLLASERPSRDNTREHMKSHCYQSRDLKKLPPPSQGLLVQHSPHWERQEKKKERW